MSNSDRADWLEARRLYVGGTDLSALLGENPYNTPLGVYADKVGLLPPATESSQMRRGTRMEPFLAATYAEMTGKSVVKCDILRHPTKSWCAANPDYHAPEDLEYVELKSHKFYLRGQYGEPGTDAVPSREVIQAQWQMHIGAHTYGYRQCTVVVAFGLDEEDILAYPIRYDPELGALFEAKVDEFWHKHVIPREPPPVSGIDAEGEILKRLYPIGQEQPAESTPETDELCALLVAAREDRKRAEKAEDALVTRIQAYMGNHETLQCKQWTINWKNRAGSPSWKSIAQEMGPSPQLIAKHTPSIGPRVFTISDRKEQT